MSPHALIPPRSPLDLSCGASVLVGGSRPCLSSLPLSFFNSRAPVPPLRPLCMLGVPSAASLYRALQMLRFLQMDGTALHQQEVTARFV